MAIIIDERFLTGSMYAPFCRTMHAPMEEWDKDREYDRLGLEENYTEYLGNKVVCHSVPIRPGRNVSIIVESAAVNHRQKKMGYNTAEEFNKRLMEQMIE